MGPPPLQLLVHVPRSGGRSIECTFGRYKFPESPAFVADRAAALAGASPHLALCCGGHATLPTLLGVFGDAGPRSRYAMLLRDPALRVASAVHYDAVHQRVHHSRVSGRLARMARDGRLSVAAYLAAPPEEKQRNIAVAQVLGRARGTDDPADLALAIERLEALGAIVGVHERLGEFVRLVRAEMGADGAKGGLTRDGAMLSCSNVGDTPAHDDVVLTRIRREHALDYSLWKWAANRFEDQWRARFGGTVRGRSTCGPARGCLRPGPRGLGGRQVRGAAAVKPGTEKVCWRVCDVNLTRH